MPEQLAKQRKEKHTLHSIILIIKQFITIREIGSKRKKVK